MLMLLSPTTVWSIEDQTKHVKILVVGDSLSAEYGLKRNSGWVKLMEQLLINKYPATSIINASISGDTTSGGLSRLPALLDREKPTFVIIELGANDALRGLSLAASEDNLKKMIQLGKQVSAKILLVGMQLPPNYGKQYSESFEKMYINIANQEKINLVPFLFKGFATNRDLFQADGIHPNETAQPIMMETVLSGLEPMIKASLRPNRP